MSIGQTILKNIWEIYPDHAHPRLVLKEEDFARLRRERNTGGYKILLDHLFQEADSALDAPVSIYDVADGIRLLPVSRAVLGRVMSLGMAYLIGGQEKYAERAWREVEAAAHFPNWNPKHFLDIGEMSFAFALFYDWMYDWMSEDKRTVLRHALIDMAFTPAMDDYLDRPRERTYRWYQHNPGDNWKFVCNGGLSMAIMAIFDDEPSDLYETILTCAFDDSYRAVRNFYSSVDGCYVEGLNYWNFASLYLSFYDTSLIHAAGSDFGLADHEGLHKSPYFVMHMCSGDFNFFNFGDAAESMACNCLFLWFGHRFHDFGLSALRLRMIEKAEMVQTWDLFYYRPEEFASPDTLPISFGGVGQDNASFRSDWSDKALYAAIHFGTNDVCHGHDDMGTFVVNIGSERFFSDLGADSYNLTPYRDTYRFRAEGHNTIWVDPAHTKGQKLSGATTVCRYSDGEGDHFAIADMSSAYDGAQVVRGLKMCDGKNAVVVRDEIKTDHLVAWSGHTEAQVTLARDRRSAVLTRGGARLWVGVLTEGLTLQVLDCAPLPSSPHVVGERPDPAHKFCKLAVYAEGNRHDAISVAMIPLREGESEPAFVPADLPLSEW